VIETVDRIRLKDFNLRTGFELCDRALMGGRIGSKVDVAHNRCIFRKPRGEGGENEQKQEQDFLHCVLQLANMR
jgi:hypothetical protein